jgi:hypothetical protein
MLCAACETSTTLVPQDGGGPAADSGVAEGGDGGVACGASSVSCTGPTAQFCADLNTDKANCGACGHLMIDHFFWLISAATQPSSKTSNFSYALPRIIQPGSPFRLRWPPSAASAKYPS